MFRIHCSPPRSGKKEIWNEKEEREFAFGAYGGFGGFGVGIREIGDVKMRKVAARQWIGHKEKEPGSRNGEWEMGNGEGEGR